MIHGLISKDIPERRPTFLCLTPFPFPLSFVHSATCPYLKLLSSPFSLLTIYGSSTVLLLCLHCLLEARRKFSDHSYVVEPETFLSAGKGVGKQAHTEAFCVNVYWKSFKDFTLNPYYYCLCNTVFKKCQLPYIKKIMK